MKKYRYSFYPVRKDLINLELIDRLNLLNMCYCFDIISDAKGDLVFKISRMIYHLNLDRYSFYVYNLNTAELDFYDKIDDFTAELVGD